MDKLQESESKPLQFYQSLDKNYLDEDRNGEINQNSLDNFF